MRAPEPRLKPAIGLAAALALAACGDGAAATAGAGARAESGSGGSARPGASGAPGGGAGANAAAGNTGADGLDAASPAAGDAACDRDCADASAGDADAPASDGAGGAAACTVCDAYAAPVLLANIGSAELAELSGIAASTRNPGVLFAHNDRARAVVYALGEDGALRGTFTMDDAAAVDVEDLAVGPCPAGSCLYLADIGGNLSPRTEFAILRLTEPALSGSGPAPDVTVEFERFRFEYDDGANHNAEGLLVEPRTGAVYVVTKVADGQPSSVYRLPHPLDAQAINVAVKVTDLPVPRADDRAASAAAAHPCGAGFVVRTYDAVYEFRVAPEAAFEDAFGVEPVSVPAADEPQSEGIAYLPDGSGFITAGETASAPIFRTTCR
jgi:hypothetical protein